MKAPQNLALSIGQNTLFGIVAKTVQFATRLITIPIVISHIGLDGYGIWAIITVTAAYMRFGSVGVKSAFQKYVAEATGKGDYEAANALLSTGCILMAILSLLLIPLAVFSRLLAAVIGVPPQFLYSTAKAISILALVMAICNVGAVFEAIIMGAHRIDLARRYTTACTLLEAMGTVLVLHLGYGLFGMALVMATSELGFVICCAVAATRIAPEVRLAHCYVSAAVISELLRYAASYQLVSVLQVLYSAILPLALLKTLGADASGIYAVVTRLTASAQLVPEALLVPLLSGSAMVYASGVVERTRTLVTNAFKVTIALSVLPLGFIAIFGVSLVFVWTGQSLPQIQIALYLASLAAFFNSLYTLQIVLYRASGGAVGDNVAQLLRLALLLAVAVLATRLGFEGMLAGLALTELAGAIWMLFTLARSFVTFRIRALGAILLRLGAASAAALASAHTTAVTLRILGPPSSRPAAALQLTVIALICMLTFLPAVRLTKSLTGEEQRAIISIFGPLLKGSA